MGCRLGGRLCPHKQTSCMYRNFGKCITNAHDCMYVHACTLYIHYYQGNHVFSVLKLLFGHAWFPWYWHVYILHSTLHYNLLTNKTVPAQAVWMLFARRETVVGQLKIAHQSLHSNTHHCAAACLHKLSTIM